MSQIVTRKGPVGEDKEKGQSADTPVKEMKKKMAANAEKEKQAAEKHADKEKEKEKPADTKQPEKAEKSVEKNSEKKEKAEKSSEKKEKHVEKEKGEKSVEKKSEPPAEKAKEDKNAKQPEKPDDKDKDKDKDKDIKEKDKKRTDTPKPKQNGARANGVPVAPGAQPANGEREHSDGTVSSDEELVIIDHERDDMFPELAYDDSDGEFEPPTPEGLPSRSYTRRSQAKAARTPETPRPASDKRADRDADDSKESKVLKLKEDAPPTDRKLRSSDSPKPESKRPEKSQEKKTGDKEKDAGRDADGAKADKASPKKKDLEVPEAKDDEGKDSSAVEIVIDVDVDEGGARKDGTNYSRSRVKVSPYRRAADRTASSVAANYTGNNTTMEMDITETSSLMEEAPTDSPYLSGLRSIRGRRSYKPLKEMALRNVGVGRSGRSVAGPLATDPPSRPTAPVVGRKRKPEGEDPAEPAAPEPAGTKRARLLDKLSRPFRHAASTPLPARRNAEIVGINTDLPLTAPVASPDTFDPETLKAAAPATPPLAAAPGPERDRDNKRCSIM